MAIMYPINPTEPEAYASGVLQGRLFASRRSSPEELSRLLAEAEADCQQNPTVSAAGFVAGVREEIDLRGGSTAGGQRRSDAN